MYDRVTIRVKAGDGGDGALSFRHEKFVPFGGPDGGDGGNGGDVVVRALTDVASLSDFRRNRLYRAEKGGRGGPKKMHGKRGEPLYLNVPPGTVVLFKREDGETELVSDLAKPGEEAIIARGGKGGRGNIHFASATNQVPREVEAGTPGEEKEITLEMRLIADIGIIGQPNAGKSSLLARASAANPKIADYPFTTLEPVLGLVNRGPEAFVLAEIPGLIEGAHTGKGLGHDFLRHALRTRLLIHLVSGTSETPVRDMLELNRELALFDANLAEKPQIVAVNKIDLPEVRARLDETGKAFREVGTPVRFISAATGEGVAELLDEAWERLKSLGGPEKPPEETAIKVFRPRPQAARREETADFSEPAAEVPAQPAGRRARRQGKGK